MLAFYVPLEMCSHKRIVAWSGLGYPLLVPVVVDLMYQYL